MLALTTAAEVHGVLGPEKSDALCRLVLSECFGVPDGDRAELARIVRREAEVCSTVYALSRRSEVSRPEKRQCRRFSHSSRAVLNFIEDELLGALLPSHSTCVCRSHFDVIMYEPGDFFKPHKDFSRIHPTEHVEPYFGVYSLANAPCKGGEFVVAGPPPAVFSAPTAPDGCAFCKSHAKHSANPVAEGYKLVLKFDFLVFRPPPLLPSLGAAGASSTLVRVALMDGAVRHTPRDVLRRVPFFEAALRFGCEEGPPPESLDVPGLSAEDYDDLVVYLEGSRRPRDAASLQKVAHALSLSEACALARSSCGLADWTRFVSGSPVWVGPDAALSLCGGSGAVVVPFLVVFAERIATSSASGPDLVFAAARTLEGPSSSAALLMASGSLAHLGRSGCRPLSRWLFEGLRRSDDHDDDPSAVARKAVAALASWSTTTAGIAAPSPVASSSDEEEPAAARSSSSLALRSPMILELVKRRPSSSPGGEPPDRQGVVVVEYEEEEYCNDGHYETFWSYESLRISAEFGIYR